MKTGLLFLAAVLLTALGIAARSARRPLRWTLFRFHLADLNRRR